MLPDKIRIMGQDIKITREKKDIEDGDYYGYFAYEIGIIYIDPDLDEQAAKRVLFHEIFHVVMYNTGLTATVNKDIEEAIARAVELNLFPLVRFKFRKKRRSR